jgi:hypothetical protein
MKQWVDVSRLRRRRSPPLKKLHQFKVRQRPLRNQVDVRRCRTQTQEKCTVADKTDIPPKLEVLLAGEARPQDRSVALSFGAAGGETVGFELDAKIVPATITALASHLGQVMSSLPEEDWPNFQVLKTTTMGLAMNAAGELALALELEGGGQLTLGLAKGDLALLRDEIDEAMRIAGELRH